MLKPMNESQQLPAFISILLAQCRGLVQKYWMFMVEALRPLLPTVINIDYGMDM